MAALKSSKSACSPLPWRKDPPQVLAENSLLRREEPVALRSWFLPALGAALPLASFSLQGWRYQGPGDTDAV